jgi:periplasmic protein TonB
MVPAPLPGQRRLASRVEQEYRIDAARHLYACYPMRVYRGKLPPLLYGVMMVETEIDAKGRWWPCASCASRRPTRWRPGWWR